MFKSRYCDFPSDGGKIVEELVESLPALQIVKQRLKRDTGSSEHRRPPEHVRVTRNNVVGYGSHS